jgi:hypothetical protein
LAARHRAAGLQGASIDGFTHELDPLELAARARIVWQRTRWPGANGRLASALVVFAAFVVRQLEYLALRIWDDGEPAAGQRLRDVQQLLDRLNAVLPHPMVRDARWLIQTAQGALTDDLGPYFEIAERAERSLDGPDRLEWHRAGAVLAGGHLRSQLRYRMWDFNQPIDAPDILAVTRNSNSMDTALLVGDLAALLEAYRDARTRGDRDAVLDLADAILQGLSADPELFLVRLDLLRPFTTIEEIFVAGGSDDTRPARLTPMGRAHADRVTRYRALIGELAGALRDDASRFDPAAVAYSPFGISYGFCADLLSTMAQSRIAGQPSYGLSLEDTFSGRHRLDDQLARARGWAALPRLEGEVEPFSHLEAWGTEIYARLMRALEARVERGEAPVASGDPTGRLYVVSADGTAGAAAHVPADAVPGAEYCFCSDPRHPSGATTAPVADILASRREGRYLASVESGGHWFAISKNVLTMETSRGRDVLLRDVPAPAVALLRLTCPDLVVG